MKLTSKKLEELVKEEMEGVLNEMPMYSDRDEELDRDIKDLCGKIYEDLKVLRELINAQHNERGYSWGPPAHTNVLYRAAGKMMEPIAKKLGLSPWG